MNNKEKRALENREMIAKKLGYESHRAYVNHYRVFIPNTKINTGSK
jgi:hypothetical protein